MIARTFYRRGIIETWGRGTLKIARLMHEQGLAPPTMAVRAGAVVVTFQVSVTEKTSEKASEKGRRKTPEKAKTREKTGEKTLENTLEKTKTVDTILQVVRDAPTPNWRRCWAGPRARSTARSGNSANLVASNASALTRAATGR